MERIAQPVTRNPQLQKIMPGRIEVAYNKGIIDPHASRLKARIKEDLGFEIDKLEIIQVYIMEDNLSQTQLEALGENLFTDPIIQHSGINTPLAKKFDWVVEVGFRPGVTDNVGKTSKEAIEDFLKIKLAGGVFSSNQYLFWGDLNTERIEIITKKILANQLIHRWSIIPKRDWDRAKGAGIYLPLVKGKHKSKVTEIPLKRSLEELLKLSKDMVWALNVEEMAAIQNYFKRSKTLKERETLGLSINPTDVEMEAIAQTWSEHCKHKIFNALITYDDGDNDTKTIDSLFETYIKKSTEIIEKRVDWLLSVFVDNAGVIKFNDRWSLVFKVETHNSPSALDPYGGALTGIVGVNRDPLGTGNGCRLIFNTNIFCFAPPFYNKEIPPILLHPRRIFEGVRQGVEHGGNKSGIPTVNGSIIFDDRFLGKPLVYCGTGGIMPSFISGKPSHIKKANPEDLVVMVGGRVGKDGIHGATFSSQELDESSPATAVQIGDPITQKKMVDFLLEARDQNLYNCITDNGAGGLSSSVGEMAQFSGGCEIYLDKVPLKYPGLYPWEILLSEAQERMTVAVPPEKIHKFLQLSKSRSVESTVIGKFTNSGKFHVFYKGKTCAYLDMDFLHKGVPQLTLKAKWKKPAFVEPDFPVKEDLTSDLLELLSRLNICSKEYIVRQYDHEVQGGSVIKPLCGKNLDGPSDAAVIRPLLDSMEGVIVAHGIVPRYSDIDTYHMMACSIDEAIRNSISVGGKPGYIAGLDNFCWCDPIKSPKNPDGEYKLAQLVRACQALFDYCTYYDLPCISGKDSMKNDFVYGDIKISIPPTVLFSTMGKIDDVQKAITMDAKNPQDVVYVIGITKPELGGSEYFASKGFIGNNVPKVDAPRAKRLYQLLSSAIERGFVASCHDCSDGGLGVALAETAFSGDLGMEIDLNKVPNENVVRDDYLLFSESQSRFVITVDPKKVFQIEALLKDNYFARVGVVREDKKFLVKGKNGEYVIDCDIDTLKYAWQKTLKW